MTGWREMLLRFYHRELFSSLTHINTTTKDIVDVRNVPSDRLHSLLPCILPPPGGVGKLFTNLADLVDDLPSLIGCFLNAYR
jgi:hypothetical protein